MKKSGKVSLFVLASFLIIFFGLRFSGITDDITLANIQEQAASLREFVHAHYFMSVISFIAFYIVIAAFALPLASLTTITGGYVFGTFLGAIYANIGATIGAAVIFLFVRYSIGDLIQERYAPTLKKFNRKFKQQGARFLIAARLIVVFPYFLVNMVAGLTSASFWTFVWTTAVGILPASLVFTFAGQQLQHINSITDIFTPQMMLALAAIALMLFIPSLFTHLINNMNGNNK